MSNVREEERTQSGILSKVIQQLECMYKKGGQDKNDMVLKNIFQNKAAKKAMQRKVGISILRKFVAD